MCHHLNFLPQQLQLMNAQVAGCQERKENNSSCKIETPGVCEFYIVVSLSLSCSNPDLLIYLTGRSLWVLS